MATKSGSGQVGATSTVVSYARMHAKTGAGAVAVGVVLVALAVALAEWPLAVAAAAVSAFAVYAAVSAVRGARDALGPVRATSESVDVPGSR